MRAWGVLLLAALLAGGLRAGAGTEAGATVARLLSSLFSGSVVMETGYSMWSVGAAAYDDASAIGLLTRGADLPACRRIALTGAVFLLVHVMIAELLARAALCARLSVASGAARWRRAARRELRALLWTRGSLLAAPLPALFFLWEAAWQDAWLVSVLTTGRVERTFVSYAVTYNVPAIELGPFAMLLGLLGFLAIHLWIQASVVRRGIETAIVRSAPPDVCPRCGYEAGQAGVGPCPECGAADGRRAGPQTPARPCRRRLLFGLYACVVLLLLTAPRGLWLASSPGGIEAAHVLHELNRATARLWDLVRKVR